MRDNKAVATLATLVTLGSGLALTFCLSSGFGPEEDPLPHRAAGRVLAEQTLSLLKPGGQVTVITRDTAFFENPAADILLTSFQKELHKAGIKIDSIHALQIDPLRPVAVPAGDFLQWIQRSAKGSVIVSLMGPPVFDPEHCRQLSEIKPAIVAFCPGPSRDQVDLRSLFARGLLQAAVVSKRAVARPKNPQPSEQEAFDRQFVAVTSGNLSALPAVSNLSP